MGAERAFKVREKHAVVANVLTKLTAVCFEVASQADGFFYSEAVCAEAS
jgi:hypothetical protein